MRSSKASVLNDGISVSLEESELIERIQEEKSISHIIKKFKEGKNGNKTLQNE